MDEPIRFDAEVRQIKSMADGSFNLIINIPEYNLEQAQELMGWLRDQIAVAIVRVSETENDYLS
jgi:hypothetical protein